ncbi:hypothetical protein B0H10DRAFT_1949741 [Mycena sp. CBHHK59/15]|nr:hypothetical protein B0H10DRAFT_1949741 [Mycena sp. CBHHK59/15]
MSTSINNIIAVKALNRSDTQYTFSEFAGLLNERPNLRSRRATRQLLALVSQPPSLYVTPHNAAARVHVVMANPIPNFPTDPDVEKIIARQVSPSDGLGFIYAYTSKSQRSRRRAPAAFIRQRGGRRARYRRAYKIGRTNNILRRKAEWRKQCGGRQEWKMSWLVPFAAKMGGSYIFFASSAVLALFILAFRGNPPYALQAHQASLANTRPMRRVRRQALREVLYDDDRTGSEYRPDIISLLCPVGLAVY